MKTKSFNSILSCILKCIGFLTIMVKKNFFLGMFVINLLGACASPTAMLGPVYTLTSSGNALQAGISYGSNEIVTMYTGKTPIDNLKELTSVKKKNVKKDTLESEEFHFLVKNRIDKTSSILNLSSQ